MGLARPFGGYSFRRKAQRLGEGFSLPLLLRKTPALAETVLEPDFVDAVFLPIGEEAHAVGAGHDAVKVFFQFAERQAFIHVLLHHVRWLNVERDLRDHAECAKPDYDSRK